MSPPPSLSTPTPTSRNLARKLWAPPIASSRLDRPPGRQPGVELVAAAAAAHSSLTRLQPSIKTGREKSDEPTRGDGLPLDSSAMPSRAPCLGARRSLAGR
jgi:hypothetical protein